MNAMGPMQSQRDALRGITYFEQDPLQTYFDECQENEIYFLNIWQW